MKRFETAALAAIMTVVFPVIVLLMGERLRRSLFTPDDPEVLLWWADALNDVTVRALGIAVVAGLALMIVILRRPNIAWWKIARWFWAASALLALGAFALSARAQVRVYADRIVTTDMVGVQHAIPMSAAREIEVWCSVISRSRNSDIPTIGYTIHFQGRSVLLRSAMGDDSHEGARRWFRKVEALDREVLAAVPHAPYGAAHDMTCVRDLRAELGEADFVAARRMLGINDADFARYYAEPHEAWKGNPRNAR
jgi:hypothetical protein